MLSDGCGSLMLDAAYARRASGLTSSTAHSRVLGAQECKTCPCGSIVFLNICAFSYIGCSSMCMLALSKKHVLGHVSHSCCRLGS